MRQVKLCLPLFPLVGLLLLSRVMPAVAQQASASGKSYNNFAMLFPTPSNQNGYEELVLAGDLISNSAVWHEYEFVAASSSSTLAQKRAVIGDAKLKKAMALIRAGLKKVIVSPHGQIDEETRYPELASFRAMARLLNVVLYVEFAEGMVTEAIDTLGEALRLGYAIQTDTVISGLVGISIDTIALTQAGNHLEQLDSRSCDRLIQLANEWLTLPDPSIQVFNGEKRMALATLKKYRSAPEKFLKAMADLAASGNSKPVEADLAKAISVNPDAASPLFDKANEIVSERYDAVIENLKRAPWERKEAKLENDGGMAERLASLILLSNANNDLIGGRYARDEAMVQLLGLHAAIRRFRWEHDRLPESLDEIKAGHLAIDPFTGKPMNYKRIDNIQYELSSVGPFDLGTGDQPPSGERVPVSFPIKRKP